METPVKVSKFAKDYEKTFTSLTQYKSAYGYLIAEREQLSANASDGRMFITQIIGTLKDKKPMPYNDTINVL